MLNLPTNLSKQPKSTQYNDTSSSSSPVGEIPKKGNEQQKNGGAAMEQQIGNELTRKDLFLKGRQSSSVAMISSSNHQLSPGSSVHSMANLYIASTKHKNIQRFDKLATLLHEDKSNVTREQLEIFKRLRSNIDFQNSISEMPYYDIPDHLNYLILLENKIKLKKTHYRFGDIQAWLANDRDKKIENYKSANELRSAARSDGNNQWVNKLQMAGISNDTVIKLDGLIEKHISIESDRDKTLLLLVNNIIHFKDKMKTTKLGSVSIEEYFNNLPKNWHSQSPWYYTYGDKFTDNAGQTGFVVLSKVLSRIKELGCNNVYLLPHYESPGGDGGYDVSNHEPSERLGGKNGFKELVLSAADKGMALMTDLVCGHVSSEHQWFKNALNGDPQYYKYFLKTPRHWKQDFTEKDNLDFNSSGGLALKFKDKGPDGEEVETKWVVIFQDFLKTCWLDKSIKGLEEQVSMNHTFYPFQIDLNLLRPEVIDEVVKVTGNEVLAGVPGCRVDAPHLLIKKIGGSNINIPECSIFFDILKTFRDALHSNTLTLPEFPAFKGNGIFEDCANIRCAAIAGEFEPFFKKIGSDLNFTEKYGGATVIHQNEKHDDTGTGDLGEEIQLKFLEKLKNRPDSRLIYRKGNSFAGRTYDALGGETKRAVCYNTLVSFLPGVPSYYYGTELGIKNDYHSLEEYQNNQFELANSLLAATGMSVTLEQCLDPRAAARARISTDLVEEKHKSSYASVVAIKELAKIREKFPVMNSNHCRQIFLKPIDGCSTKEVFSIAKLPENESQRKFILINLSNMSDYPKALEICMNDSMPEIKDSKFSVKSEMSFTTNGEKLDVRDFNPLRVSSDRNIQLDLKPYQSIIISLDGDDFHKCFSQKSPE